MTLSIPLDQVARERTPWGDVGRTFVILAILEILIAILLDQSLLSSSAIRTLAGGAASERTAFLKVIAIHSGITATLLILRTVLVALTIQCVLATLDLTYDLPRAFVDAMWATGVLLLIGVVRLAVAWVGHSAATPTSASFVVPGSAAQLVGAHWRLSTPIVALLNLASPFELGWCGVLAWRLRWVRSHGRSPIRLAFAAWALTTLSPWLLSHGVLSILHG